MRIALRHSKTGAVPATPARGLFSSQPRHAAIDHAEKAQRDDDQDQHADHDDDDLRRLSERREVRMTSIR